MKRHIVEKGLTRDVISMMGPFNLTIAHFSVDPNASEKSKNSSLFGVWRQFDKDMSYSPL